MTTMSLRRPGIASPALAAVASRRFFFRARVSMPIVTLEDNAEGVVCACLCVVVCRGFPEKRFSVWETPKNRPPIFVLKSPNHD